MTETDVLADLDRSLSATQTVVAGVGADQWQAPAVDRLAGFLGRPV